MSTVFGGDVIPSVSIDNMVNQRNAVLERLRAAMEATWEAHAIAKKAHLGFPAITQRVKGIDRSVYDYKRQEHYKSLADTDEDEPPVDKVSVIDRLTKSVDAGAWQYLMDESGFRTFMDIETRRSWDDRIYNNDVPEFDIDTIKATFQAMYLNRSGMLEDGVIKCFKRLSWCYKTNQPFRFGKRIILSYFGEYNHKRCEELDDLVRVFHVLDGKPEPDHRNGMYRFVGEAYRATKTWPKLCETDYLRIKLFKKGTAHIEFKRADVVDAMNKMLARRYPGALPYDRSAA